MNNEQTEEQNIANDPSTVESPRKKTLTEDALEATRRNATKSSGPRTPAGKLKAASNSLKHGLYSLRNFDNFIAHHDQAPGKLNQAAKNLGRNEVVVYSWLFRLEGQEIARNRTPVKTTLTARRIRAARTAAAPRAEASYMAAKKHKSHTGSGIFG